MAKKVAVLAVNPVNGCGLFQYLEAFFENGIPYKVFAVSDTKEIKTYLLVWKMILMSQEFLYPQQHRWSLSPCSLPHHQPSVSKKLP